MTNEQELVRSLFRRLTRSAANTFPLPRKSVDAPRSLGVYVVYDAKGVALHVGNTPRAKGGLRQRLRDHLVGRSSFTREYLKGKGHRLRGRYKFRYIEVPDARMRMLVEAFTIGHLCPRHIGSGQSKKLPK